MMRKNNLWAQKWFRPLMLAVGLLSAVAITFVYYRRSGVYPSVVLKDYYSLNYLVLILLCGLLMAFFGSAIRLFIDRSHRKLQAIFVFLILMVLAYYYLLDNLSIIFTNATDNIRVILVILGYACFGFGIELGSHISKRETPIWFIGLCFLLPLVTITLLSHAMRQLFGLVWLMLLSYALGIKVINTHNRHFYAKPISPELAICTGLGLTAMILLLFAAGMVGFSNRWAILVVWIMLTVVSFPEIKTTFKSMAKLPWRKPVDHAWFELVMVLVLFGLFTIFWLNVIAPETGPDAIGARTAMASIWLRDGRIIPIPEIMISYGVMAGEIALLLGMPFFGFETAKIITYGLSVVLVMSTAFSLPTLKNKYFLFAFLTAFFGSTVVWWQFFAGFVDLFQLFFVVASVLSIYRWKEDDHQPTWLIVAGVLAAVATATKLNGAVAILIGLPVILYCGVKRGQQLKKIIGSVVIYTISFTILLLPWLIRSAILTKNPFFPFANSIFNSPLLNTLPMYYFGVDLLSREMIKLPILIFSQPFRFNELGVYSPFLLSTSMIGLMGYAMAKKQEWFWLAASLVGFTAWALSAQNLRYGMIFMYFFVIAISIGTPFFYDAIQRKALQTGFRFFILGLVIISLSLGVFQTRLFFSNRTSGPAFPDRVTIGDQPRSAFLSVHLPTYFCAEWANQIEGESTRILQLDHRDHLYFDAPTSSIPHGIKSVTGPIHQFLANQHNPDQMHQILLDEGYSHLLLNPQRMEDPHHPLFNFLPTNDQNTHLILVCESRELNIYEIKHDS